MIDWRVPFGANPFDNLNAGDGALQAETIPLQYQNWQTGFALATTSIQGTVATAPNGGASTMPQCFEAQMTSGTLTAMDANLLVNLQPDGYHCAPEAVGYQPLGYFLAPLPFATLATPPASAQAANVPTGFVVERPSAGVEGPWSLTPGNVHYSTVQGTHEMDARHVSLWIKPTVDWTSGIIPIWELRAPTANISPQAYDVAGSTGDLTTANAPGSNGSQNYLGLDYDAKTGLLVLSISPPSIEHTVASAMSVPDQDPSNQTVDTSTLGASSVLAYPGATLRPLAPQPFQNGGSAFQSISPLFVANRILHLYQIPLASDPRNNFFRANVWHHIEVAIASDRPQDSAIIVDGVVGQDITKTPLPTMTNFGDHCTLPCLPLAAKITEQPVATGDPSNPLGPALPSVGIQVTPITVAGTTLTANDLLPARGTVRIDDEYFLYDSISSDGKTLQGFKGAATYGPLRGRRQGTNASVAQPAPPAIDPRFPMTQEHESTALVTPGGYRVVANNGLGGRLYAGGSSLQIPMPPGDAANGNRVWATIDPKQSPVINLTGTQYVWPYTQGCNLPLASTGGTPGSFTGPGIVMITDQNGFASYYYFQSAAGGVLTNLQVIQGANFTKYVDGTPGTNFPQGASVTYAGTTYPIAVPFNAPLGGLGATVCLASVYANGTPWTTYDSRGQSFNDGQDIIGLLMPASSGDASHVEWLTYNAIITDTIDATAGGFFVSTTGFASDTVNGGHGRGVERTQMTATPFPAQSKILPVQTEIGQCGHWIGTGDVVTIIGHASPAGPPPENAAAAANPIPVLYAAYAATATTPYPAVQMTVRYGATDGYPVSPGTWNDSKNEYFCFSDFMPPAFQAAGSIGYANLEIISGNCWSGDDLTPDVQFGVQRMTEPRGYLPRLDLWYDPTANATAANADAAVFFGSLDPRPHRAADDAWAMQNLFNGYGSYPSGTPGGGTAAINTVDNVECVIDGICAGPLSPAVNSNTLTLMQDDGHDLAAGPIGQTTPANASLMQQGSPNPFAPLPSYIDCVFQSTPPAFTTPQIPLASPPPAGTAQIPLGSNLVGMLVHATSPIFPYGTCGNMGLVLIDGEVFAYQVPTPADQASISNLVSHITWSDPRQLSCYARLVARGLLGSTAVDHTIGPGPLLSDYALHNARLSAMRLPLGPVLQLQTTIAFDPTSGVSNWFTLSDQDATVPGLPCPLYAPSALLCSSSGLAMEMMGMNGPLTHRSDKSVAAYPNQFPNQGQYTSASWLRGLYNTKVNPAAWSAQNAGQGYPPIVIGWWPRYASAYPDPTTITLTAQHLRSRFYAWFGLPVPAYGAYFDTVRRDTYFHGTNLAELEDDDLNAYFTVEARALSYQDRWTGASTVAGQGSMDWSLQDAVVLPASNGTALQDLSSVFLDGNDKARCFNGTVNTVTQALPVDGAEVRVCWRYSADPPLQTVALMPAAWQALGQACGSTPIFANADVRYLAPVRVLATERSR